MRIELLIVKRLNYSEKKHMHITKAKIKRAESGNLKGVTSNKHHRKLTVMCSEMPASF